METPEGQALFQKRMCDEQIKRSRKLLDQFEAEHAELIKEARIATLLGNYDAWCEAHPEYVQAMESLEEQCMRPEWERTLTNEEFLEWIHAE
jgi:hypothetical protein